MWILLMILFSNVGAIILHTDHVIYKGDLSGFEYEISANDSFSLHDDLGKLAIYGNGWSKGSIELETQHISITVSGPTEVDYKINAYSCGKEKKPTVSEDVVVAISSLIATLITLSLLGVCLWYYTKGRKYDTIIRKEYI